MNVEQGSPTPVPLASGQFAGRDAFARLVRDAFAGAARDGWPEIILSDATFEDWPLRERVVVESLQAWGKSGRRLVMLATSYTEVVRLHPRFVAWRKTWGHIVESRLCRGASPADFPSVIWSPSWYMRRLDLQRSTGVCGSDRDYSRQIKELLDENLRNSSAGLNVSVLGL